jgi:hypothetical protein
MRDSARSGFYRKEGEVMIRSGFLLVLGALFACVVLATGASAGGGDSANAKMCQQGWMNYVHADGTPFKSQGDCVSYAAHGNMNPEQLCIGFGGQYSPYIFPAGVWLCNRYTYSGPSLEGAPESLTLQAVCKMPVFEAFSPPNPEPFIATAFCYVN